ncbi:hypothetical protein KIF24_24235 [Micromonospora sp. Llam7]|uniref:hypothetical protein n=1 Tax=Micromonospora tarapacensis TaxID=2835305 RepID=UPI001C82ACAB|nr:hypothetical protein [Micromonospora tarapacensis]MBX7268822.1 hypothetical protein [Micromonospora tarapacensis]
MDKPRKKIRVVGQRRTELDIERFADAIIAFALHQMCAESEPADGPDDGQAAHGEERSA